LLDSLLQEREFNPQRIRQHFLFDCLVGIVKNIQP